MSQRQKQTAFLKTLVLHGGTEERRHLFNRISKAERDEHSSWCALWLVIVLSLLSVCGLCYSSVLLPDFFRSSTPHVVVKIFCMIGLASAACSVAFMGCWLWYRGNLNRLHQEARRFIMEILESQPALRSAHSLSAAGVDPASNSIAGTHVGPRLPARHASYWELFRFRNWS